MTQSIVIVLTKKPDGTFDGFGLGVKVNAIKDLKSEEVDLTVETDELSDIDKIRRFFDHPTRQDIEEEAGVGKGYISKLLKGDDRSPNKDKVERILEVINRHR